MTQAPMISPNGFLKFDLHVHTPISYCYEDHMSPDLNLDTQPQDIVQASLAAGLHGLAVTDHNSEAFIDRLRAAAEGTGLIIFPGLEITSEGGHILAIFDPKIPASYLLRLVRSLGFTPEHDGDGVASTKYWIDEVAHAIEDWGGLAIPAHIDRNPRGFWAAPITRPEKQRIHNSPHNSALEITDPRDKQKWNQGLMPYFEKPYACTQGSDAHAPKEIGRRPIYLNMPSLDLAGMRTALRDYEARVRFPWELEGRSGPQEQTIARTPSPLPKPPPTL